MVDRAPTGALAKHEAESVESLAALHQEHQDHAGALQTGIDAITDHLGRPAIVLVILGLLAGWTVVAWMRSPDINGRSLSWIEFAGTIGALVVAMLILVTQRREDKLAARQAKLTLELALLADRKSSKIIELIEALRRDHPGVADRIDAETDAMAKPADPKSVLEAIDKSTPDRTD